MTMHPDQAEEDFYSYLGVLPEAELVVITAAYRALTSKYHPDRWTGDPAVGHLRMAQVNRAYEVLRDVESRAKYDKRYAGRSSSASFEQQEHEEATFQDATADLDARWAVATSVMPELAGLRGQLAKTSHQLAFAFVTTLVETRRFKDAEVIAAALEQHFLERFFGTHPKIIEYARSLIQMGMRDAVKSLNRLVDVLGSSVDPDLLITKVDGDFGISEKRRAKSEAAEAARRSEQKRRDEAERIPHLMRSLKRDRFVEDAMDLAVALGYEVQEYGGGFLSPRKFKVQKPGLMEERIFSSAGEFIRWAVAELTRH